MKLKQIIAAALTLVVTLTACGQKKSVEKEGKQESGKTLVAYFSATGTTAKVATELAEVMGADLFEIAPVTPYTEADLNWNDSTSRSTIEMHDLDFRPPVKEKLANMADYDTVFLGYPVWWFIAPTIMNTFIESYDLDGKTVICFATSGGSPIEPCVEGLKKQYPNIKWLDGKLLNDATKQDLEAWKAELGR